MDDTAQGIAREQWDGATDRGDGDLVTEAGVRASRLQHQLAQSAEAMIAEGCDIYALASQLSSLIRAELGLDHVAFILIDHDKEMGYHLGHAALFDWPITPGYRQELGVGVTGRVARNGRTELVRDARGDRDYIAVLDAVTSELSIPIWSEQQAIALLNCESTTAEALEKNLHFLEVASVAVAPFLARAVRDHRKDEALRRSERQAQQLATVNEVARIALLDLELGPMLQRITDALFSKFDWEFVACVSIDRQAGTFRCEAVTSRHPTEISIGYSRSLGSGIVGEVALTGHPILVDDVRLHDNYVETTRGVRSELAVPVKHGGKVIAVLNLESTRYAAFQDQLPLLVTVADQVAGAIANARLYEEVRLRASHMEMMSGISRSALEAGELSLLLDRVVSYIDEKFSLQVASVILLNEEESLFEVAAHSSRTPVVARAGGWGVAGVIGRAVRLGVPQLVLDVDRDPEFIRIEPTVVAELAIPIRFGDRILGVINLESSDARTFSAENVGVMQTLADQVAGAIHLASLNKRLLETNRLVQEKSRELEAANQQLTEANRLLRELSMHDGLTGVANRRHFDEAIELEWRRASRSGAVLSLVMIDIDRFKAFNDSFGHLRGDECLKEIANVLMSGAKRAGDVVARYGGEEFAVILTSCDAAIATSIAEALRKRVEVLGIAHDGVNAAVVTVSAGVASAQPSASTSPSDLIAAADHALYLAKRAGGNCVRSTSPF